MIYYPIPTRFRMRSTLTISRTFRVISFARTTSRSIAFSLYTTRTLAITKGLLHKIKHKLLHDVFKHKRKRKYAKICKFLLTMLCVKYDNFLRSLLWRIAFRLVSDSFRIFFICAEQMRTR